MTGVVRTLAEHDALIARTGSFGVPTIVLDAGEGPAIFGPVISELPDDDDAVTPGGEAEDAHLAVLLPTHADGQTLADAFAARLVPASRFRGRHQGAAGAWSDQRSAQPAARSARAATDRSRTSLRYRRYHL